MSEAMTRGGVCDPLLDALKECLLKSDCVVKQNRLPSECLKNHFNELEEPCKHLRLALFDCKRSKLDMRKRFRGHASVKPAHGLASSSSAPTPNTSPAVDAAVKADLAQNQRTL